MAATKPTGPGEHSAFGRGSGSQWPDEPLRYLHSRPSGRPPLQRSTRGSEGNRNGAPPPETIIRPKSQRYHPDRGCRGSDASEIAQRRRSISTISISTTTPVVVSLQ